MVLWGGTVDLYSQQVWTYDFGDATGTFDSGDEINPALLPSTQTDGGDIRLRIGTAGGQVSVNDDNSVRTFSSMKIVSPQTTSSNKFVVQGYDGSQTFYTGFSFKLSGGNDGNIHFIEGGDSYYETNSGFLSDSFMGIRWSFEENDVIETNLARTSVTWSPSLIDEENLFLKNEIYRVEIYGNNLLTEQYYYRNGIEYILLSKDWALWINGNHVGDFGKQNSFDEINSVNSFMFYAQNSTDNVAQIEIDDIVYSNSLPDLRTVEGGAGWRMLASPYDGFNVDQLSRQNLVQGIAVGDYEDNGYSDDHLNVYTGYNGTEWVAANNVDNKLNRGNGFIWYMHDTGTGVVENKPLPLDIYSTGTQAVGDVTVDLHNDGDKWNLLGNPFNKDLDVSGIENWTQGNIANAIVQIWDGESYVTSTTNGDKVAAFQGFFLENNDAAQLEIPTTATTDGADFQKTVQESNRLIALKLTGSDGVNNYTDRAFSFYFHEDAEDGWDLWDASKLTPLLNNYVNLAFVGERDSETRLKAQESRPYNPDNFEVPARLISAGVDGTFTLDINNKVNIPDGWIVEVTDQETGVTTNLMENDYQFEVTSNHSAKNLSGSKIAPEVATMNKATGSDRFTFKVITGESAPVDPDSELPAHVALEQNYPNPFNPATIINYDIPEQSHVRLAVYDLLGRQVDLLVNETRAAGTYNITWDASQLSSGVYIYRLETAGQTLTRQMTLIK